MAVCKLDNVFVNDSRMPEAFRQGHGRTQHRQRTPDLCPRRTQESSEHANYLSSKALQHSAGGSDEGRGTNDETMKENDRDIWTLVLRTAE